MTDDEKQRIAARMGEAAFARRDHLEQNRELKLGGRIRWCPMRFVRPIALLAVKCVGLWRVGHREFLNLQLRENTVALKTLPPQFDGFRILHLSDLHLDLDTKLTDAIREKVGGLDYDVAVVTGDFNNYTYHTDGSALREMAVLMDAFAAPVYGVLGNHDSLCDIATLEAMGVRMLLNEHVALEKNGVQIFLAGIDDSNIFKTHDLARAFSGIPDSATKILLSHSPSIHAEAAAHGVDFVMAGHVHGGQICLPGGIMIHPRNDRAHKKSWRGTWHENNTQGYTSAGTGACGIPVRLNCPPEIAIHTLRRA